MLSFVRRLVSSVFFHQITAVSYGVHSQNTPLKREFLKVATFFSVQRNFTIANENRIDLKGVGEVPDSEFPTYKEFLSQLPSEETYIQALTKALDCQKKDLKIIQQENTFWRNLPLDILLERIKVFEELGVQKDDLRMHSSLLFHNFETSFRVLSFACELLECDGHMLLPLVLLPKSKVESYLNSVPSESKVLGKSKNRIKFFSDELQVPVRLFTEQLHVHSYLLKVSLTRIFKFLDILQEANVNRLDVFSDLWVFRGNIEKAEQRAQILKQIGLKNTKPWLFRCQEEFFWRNVKNKKAKQAMGSESSWEEFIAKSLNCSIKEVEAMAKYDPRVLRVSFKKSRETIDYLLSEGFTPKEIVQSPHVFCSSVRMLKKRLNMVKNAGLVPHHHTEVLRRMCLSTAAFADTLTRYSVNPEKSFPHKKSDEQ